MTKAEWIETETDDGSFKSYVARPETPNGTCLIVFQEIFGVNENIRKTCDSFANKGFLAVAPDVFWRMEPGLELDPSQEDDRTKAMGLMQTLDQELAVDDAIKAARQVQQSDDTSVHLAAVGYCLGGKLAFLASMREEVAAAVSYYGVGIQNALGEVEQVKAPLLLHLAGDDHLCPPVAQKQIENAFSDMDHVQVSVHDGVGHAFARIGSPAYVSDTAQNANDQTMQFLADKLQG